MISKHPANIRVIAILSAVSLLSLAALAQQGRQYTMEDYAAAEKFMAYNVNPLAYPGQVRPTWLPAEGDNRFWYKAADESGVTYTIVDPAKGTKAPSLRSGESVTGSGFLPGVSAGVMRVQV